MRAWRCPHCIVHTLKDGRVYILDTGQKVHFERLKPHNSGPLEFAATPLYTSDIAVVMDPEPERSVKPIYDDSSKPSYNTERLLSEVSNVSLLSRKRHWMDTRLRTNLRAGRTRQHCQYFDYSTSKTDDETSRAMLPIPTFSPQQVQNQPPPDLMVDPMALDSLSDVSMLSCLPQLFSDHEPTRSPSPQLSQSDKTTELSLTGTSAPLLTQPSFTDYLSNYPLWPNQVKDSNAPLSCPSSPSMDTAPVVLPPPTAPSIKRGRGYLGRRHEYPVSGKLRAKQRPRCRHQHRTLRWDLSTGTN